ncbi:tRNA pseudouridine(55) synthase TruB [Oceanitalea stevensii]|uniref:tRNA pseudouridine synthase B n=1 Tax=Oceanitalea stevensii TaxID=2763072 RepID=A0ABR8YYK3_9MICO|nr:tRNA pseudouridine(55) synthase TruB [Oceanitalea stevensii]MBD8060796.1 tRNA pseudouridine(55) synthase TruB [Oceanitalea stevensii]
MTERRSPSGASDPVDGLLVVDKPSGWTSHDVVGRVRRLAGTRKVGHAGTLDPMATGVLVLGVNRATRLLTYLVGADKEYTATVRLGQATVTDDAEGDVTDAPGAAAVDPDALAAAVAALRGPIEQVPSSVSAIKVDGKRSYARVRGGEEVELAARPVTIHRLDVLAQRTTTAQDGTAVTDLDVVVGCSSGTYVRALARDLGTALGTGGHLTALRRTYVGPFALDGAADLDTLGAEHAEGRPVQLLSTTEACRAAFDLRELSDSETTAVRYGQRVDATGRPGPVAALAPDGHVVALLEDRGAQARPVLVLDPA